MNAVSALRIESETDLRRVASQAERAANSGDEPLSGSAPLPGWRVNVDMP
jgi:hypothetical protein